jgi:hypothetical protein
MLNRTEYKKPNCICHFCRKSENRTRVTQIEFYPCSFCNKTYCEQCTLENSNIMPDIYGCLYCQGLCCCLKKCNQNHKCCYNLRRSQKENRLKRKYSQMHRTGLFKLIQVLEPEFDTFKEEHIYRPIPLRVIRK